MKAAGSSGNPIKVRVSGDVVISQRTKKTGWSTYGSNIWYCTHSSTMNQLFMDGVFGVRHAGATLAAEGDYLVDLAGAYYGSVANRLYLYTGGNTSEYDPDNRYADVDVTNSSRSYAFDFNGYDYIELDASDGSLTAEKVYHSAVHSDAADTGGQTGLSVINVIAQRAGRNGIILSKGADFLIDGCLARYCGKSGIYSALCTGAVLVQNSESYENGRYQDAAFDAVLVDTSGFGFWGNVDQSLQKETIIQNCYSHHNGPVGGGGSGSYGVGIWFDSCDGAAFATRNVARKNRVEDNEGNGLYIEKCFYTDVYGNTVLRNGLNVSANGIYVDSKDGKDCTDNRIISNFVVGNNVGIRCVGDTTSGGAMDNNLFSQNHCYGNVSRQLWGRSGGDNLTYGSGNQYIMNYFGPEATGFIIWTAGTTYSTYAAWEAAANATAAGTVYTADAYWSRLLPSWYRRL